MIDLKHNFNPFPPQVRSGSPTAGLARVCTDAVLALLGLIAVDSIYNLPMAVRLLLLAGAPIVIGVEAARLFFRSGAIPNSPIRPERSGFIHRCIIGGLLLLFCVGAVAVRPAYMRREMNRVLLPWDDRTPTGPTQAEQEQRPDGQPQRVAGSDDSGNNAIELKVEPGNTEIQRGDSLRIVVAPTRAIAPVALRFRGADGRWVIKPMPEDSAQPDKFSGFLRDVSTDLAYQVVMGSAVSPVYNVRVYDVAGLKAIRLSYMYPVSAGLTDRIVTGTDGTIEAVEGTRVEVTLLATGPLRTSSLQLDGGPALPMDVRGVEASRIIEVMRNGEYALTALDAKGTPLDLPGRFGIRAIQTARPKIEAGQESVLPPME